MILHFIRNLDKIPFGSSEAASILKKTIPQLLPQGKWLSTLNELDEKKLAKAFFFFEPFKALFFDPENKILVVLGSLDHLHVLYEGDFQKIKPFLTILHTTLNFAFDPNFGFLTTKLETTGTALKVKFFHGILYPKKPDNIEAIPFEGGYIYQNAFSIGLLESTLVEHLKNLHNSLEIYSEEMHKSGSMIAQSIFERYSES